ncbi:GpE family phage tail protein [Variovorax sp. OK605]|nr:GpE family phage tail protein [Variovorax sp. OK605]
MADIAFVFHWSPAQMDDMTVSDLMQWRERARERHEPPK